MRVRTKKASKKMFSVVISLFFLSACGNSKQLATEKESLQKENEGLKVQVQQLTAENNKFKMELEIAKTELEDLKQTDQYLFSKAKEYFESSNLKDAKDLLDKLFTRFPNSIYKTQASGLLKDVNSKIAIIDTVENGEREIESAISNQEFGKAWAMLKSIKKYISADSYNKVAKEIDYEQNKPIHTTINQLVSDMGNPRNVQVKWLNKRVIVDATFTAVDRGNKTLNAYSDGRYRGSELKVTYEGTNLESLFTNRDPIPDNRYMVTGIVKLGIPFSYNPYIEAEKIDEISAGYWIRP